MSNPNTQRTKNSAPSAFGKSLLGKAATGALIATPAAIVMGPAVVNTIKGKESPEPKVRDFHIVQQGDTRETIAEQMANDPNGKLKVSAEELQKYMHQELNPAAGTVQNPNDAVLQVGEKVVAEVPVSKNHE